MPERRFFGVWENILVGIALLFLIGSVTALALWQEIPEDYRAPITLIDGLAFLINYGLLCLVESIHIRRRKQRWQRIMQTWREGASDQPAFRHAHQLTSGALRVLAWQIYAVIGYRIEDISDEGIDDHIIKLVNPEGKVELVHCRQEPEPLDTTHLRMLKKVMDEENAICGYIWAPGGFSSDAYSWAKNQPIILAGAVEIGRLVDCTQETFRNI